MPVTRAFRSGNSQAIRIPSELAYDDPSAELTITRLGDVITIYPTRLTLHQAIENLRQMPAPTTIEQREPIELPDRGLD